MRLSDRIPDASWIGDDHLDYLEEEDDNTE
jgi:hypothetical protein